MVLGCLDVCLTPPEMVPVPYTIVARLGQSLRTVPTVFSGGKPVFNESSRLSRVEGNEAGTGGGVVCGVNLGYCRPLTCCPAVRARGLPVSYHTDTFAMNCAGPDGPADTVLGKLVYVLPGARQTSIAADGSRWLHRLPSSKGMPPSPPIRSAQSPAWSPNPSTRFAPTGDKETTATRPSTLPISSST